MVAPEWVKQALDEELEDDEEISKTEILEDDKLAVVATSHRGFIVRDRLLRSAKVWDFDVQVPAGTNGQTGTPVDEETTTEPLPDAVATDDDAQDEDEAPEAEPDEANADEPEPEPEPESAPELEDLDGIGPARATTLAGLGIGTYADLAAADAEDVADELGIALDTVDAWMDEIDLTRIHGIGPTRSTRLREHGIETVEALVEADAEAIAEALDVPLGTVRSWQTDGLEDDIEALTAVDGIGEARAEQLVQLGVRSLEALVAAEPETLADEMDVSDEMAIGWQKSAVEVLSDETDLLDVDGIGLARARDLIRAGVRDRAGFAAADPAELAEALDVTEATVAGWQDGA